MISIRLYAPEGDIKDDNVQNTYRLALHRHNRQRLLNAIIHVESRGNPKAINRKENAVGILQIRPIMLRHVNRLTGSNYKLKDRYDPDKSIAMFDSLMKYSNPSYAVDTACMLWNSGRRTRIKAVDSYIRKVVDML